MPPAPQPTASLVIEQTSLVVRPCPQSCGTDEFLYEPRFQLRETSGMSGATIRDFFVGDIRGGGESTGLELVGVLRSLGRREDCRWHRRHIRDVYR